MINSVVLVGNLVREVELQNIKTKGGTTQLAKFTIAVNKDKDVAYFFDCFAWGDLAKNIEKYFGKGSKIAISGELVQEVYETKEGKKASSIKVNVRNFEFTSSKE